MESLSRPSRRNREKLSNAKKSNAYDDVVFAAGAPKFGAPPTRSSPIEDYGQIFGASRASSIPILDLSAVDRGKVSADGRSSKVDYSKIFGGFHDEDGAVSYEEMFAKPKGAKNFSDEPRTPAKTAAHSDRSDRLNHYKGEGFQYEAPNQSFEGMKQFSMSYHKTSQRSNERKTGTTHVAQLRAIPGFTRFIDESHTLQKTEGDKSVPLPKVDAKSPPKVYCNFTKNQTSVGTGKFESRSSSEKFSSIDGKSFTANDPKTHHSKMSSSSSLPANLFSNKSVTKRSLDPYLKVPEGYASKAGPGYCSPSSSDEELDVNSAAAASAAALRKALETAQASIRFAKEFMERKKDGPQRFSKPSSMDSLDAKNQKEDKVTVEASRIREKNSREFYDSADVVFQVFSKSEREKARRSGKVAPDLKESEDISIAKEVAGGTNGNKLESAEDCEESRQISEMANRVECRTTTSACEDANGRHNVTPSVDSQRCGRKEMETGEEILEQRDGNGDKVYEEAQKGEDWERKPNTVRKAREWEQDAYRLAQEDEENGEKQKFSAAQEKCEKELEDSPRTDENVECESMQVKAHNNVGAGIAQKDEETEEKQEASAAQENCHKESEDSLRRDENVEFESLRVKALYNEGGIHEAQECMEDVKKVEDIFDEEQNGKTLKFVHKEEESENNNLKKISEQDEIVDRQQASCLWEDYEEACEVESIGKRQTDAHEGEGSENSFDKIHELDIDINRLNGTSDGEESEERYVDGSDWEEEEEEDEKILVEPHEYAETESIQRVIEYSEMKESNQEVVEETMNLDATSNASEQDADESLSKSDEGHRRDQNDFNDWSCNEIGTISDVTRSSCEFKEDEDGLEAVEVAHEVGVKERCNSVSLVGGAGEHIYTENKMNDGSEALLFDDNAADISLADTINGTKQRDQNEKESELTSDMGSGIKISVCEAVESEKEVDDKLFFDLEEVNDEEESELTSDLGSGIDLGKETERPQPPSLFKGEERTIATDEEESELTFDMGSGIKISVCEEVESEKEVDDKLFFDLEEVNDEEEPELTSDLGSGIDMGKETEPPEPPSLSKEEERTIAIDEEESELTFDMGSGIKISRCEAVESEKEVDDKLFFDLEEVNDEEEPELTSDLGGGVDMGKETEPPQPTSLSKEEERTIAIDEDESELTSGTGTGIKFDSAESEKEVDDKIVFDVDEVKSNFSTPRKRRQWFEMGKKVELPQPPNLFEGDEKTIAIDEEESELISGTGTGINISVCESVESEKEVDDKIVFDEDEVKTDFSTPRKRRQWFDMGKKVEPPQPPNPFKGEEKTTTDEEIKISQITERNVENLNKTFAVEEMETKETEQKEVKMEKEHTRKIDEAKKREREREKDRIAVDRAIREARERAFAEARERAERAAVEKATADARKRVVAEAREKLEKASAAAKSSAEKASIEAKLRAERAAVERATSEARERALEKALSQKATSGAKEQAERYVAEKSSGVSRDNGMRQSFHSSVSDTKKLDETNSELVQRRKAVSERHQRTMERAAKALAEKNRRDLLAQKEQAERNRLAETLDADVKRWSSGKEGNLRALLSTLQYILGPNSGWQPVTLTDIVTTNAVKKAYRKATLHVHPDKLQQRGASIQQKYICEKVFDLLKAAWNRFNSEER